MLFADYLLFLHPIKVQINRKDMKKLFLMGVAACALTACTSSSSQTEEINDSTTPLHLLKPEYKVPYGELTADEVKADLDRVVNYCEQGSFRIGSYEWGITYQALLDAADATGEQRYRDYVANKFQLIAEAVAAVEKQDTANIQVEKAQLEQIMHPHALDDCGTMCTAMMKATKRAVAPVPLDDIIDNYFQFVEKGQYRLKDGLFARHRPQHNTVWLDDMYMGIPTIAYAGIYFNDSKYFDEATTMYKNFVKRMWVMDKQIYRHGYVEGLAQQPTYHWARANGWALLTTVELLDMIPENHPDREYILNQLRAHVAGLCALQSSEGFWHQLLDRNDSYLETSATAIYCYSIAHAIRKGWIEGITYGGVAQLAWHAISTKITEDGKVAGTCVGTGMAFDPAFYYYRPVSTAAAHGYGPVIWAAAEMINLLGEWYPRTNDSGLHYYEQEQTNPSPLFYLTEDGQGEAVVH